MRCWALYTGLALIVAPGLLAIGRIVPAQVQMLVFVSGIAIFLIGVFLGTYSSALRGAPLIVSSPVQGQWMAVNSPASRVPSHGTHSFGQAYAIDLISWPGGVDGNGAKKAFVLPQHFSSFGEPVLAVANATVVRVHDRQRDHKSRLTKVGYFYFAFESCVRSLGPPSLILGNHLVLRLDDGAHMLYAHLRRGSLRVAMGGRVAAGNLIAECGNSGNSVIPHLHIQRQDVPSGVSPPPACRGQSLA